MSIIFGLQSLERMPVEESDLRNLGDRTRAYAPDGTFTLIGGDVGMGFQPNCTHERSRLCPQPAVDAAGNMIAFDGRLDNYSELSDQIHLAPQDTTDSQIVLAAFERWGAGCFGRLVGDWALALWSRSDRTLYLARDHAGSRSLYYEIAHGYTRWSTYLETFFASERSRGLCPAYAIRYLTCQPLGTFTPYAGISAVPPSHYVLIRRDRQEVSAHWTPLVRERIRYRDDRDYDEHFRVVLTTAVERRSAVQDPIVAELSGGMDSTSIVCISDRIRTGQGQGSESLIDTVSYYDDSESSWDEFPFFSATEAQRGKTGIHFRMSTADRTFLPTPPDAGVRLLPGGDSGTAHREAALDRILTGRGYRAMISGIGGDETLGGLPDSRPELADALLEGNWAAFFSHSIDWALALREPIGRVLKDAAWYALSAYTGLSFRRELPPWLLEGLETGPAVLKRPSLPVPGDRFTRPSSIGNSIAWQYLLDSLPSSMPAGPVRREYRYPLLDRDFVEFMFKIPREQIQRPGRRRHLQRRALAGVVPSAVLGRRRKAFAHYGSLIALRRERNRLSALFQNPSLERHGFISPGRMREAIDLVVSGVMPQWRRALLRTIDFELWLSHTQAIT